eukprot:m.262302 g.262302  ORF g.262302 m.262302 type:complete len:308 (+) comp22760_c0_seq21:514-1437(+)
MWPQVIAMMNARRRAGIGASGSSGASSQLKDSTDGKDDGRSGSSLVPSSLLLRLRLAAFSSEDLCVFRSCSSLTINSSVGHSMQATSLCHSDSSASLPPQLGSQSSTDPKYSCSTCCISSSAAPPAYCSSMALNNLLLGVWKETRLAMMRLSFSSEAIWGGKSRNIFGFKIGGTKWSISAEQRRQGAGVEKNMRIVFLLEGLAPWFTIVSRESRELSIARNCCGAALGHVRPSRGGGWGWFALLPSGTGRSCWGAEARALRGRGRGGSRQGEPLLGLFPTKQLVVAHVVVRKGKRKKHNSAKPAERQ